MHHHSALTNNELFPGISVRKTWRGAAMKVKNVYIANILRHKHDEWQIRKIL
jgi:hypothetical protein